LKQECAGEAVERRAREGPRERLELASQSKGSTEIPLNDARRISTHRGALSHNDVTVRSDGMFGLLCDCFDVAVTMEHVFTIQDIMEC
jgi:hypothetical protein